MKPLLFHIILLAATLRTLSQTVPFDSDRWEIHARESKVTEYLGRTALLMKGGIAVVKQSDLVDGIVEFDVAVTGERGFMGVCWRLQDFENFEEFYIRPHQSGNPDANQYQPVFNGCDAWQLYYGAGYSAPVRYVFNEWMHVRIVVSGKNAEVYIRDMETPALFVDDLRRDVISGAVGLTVGNFAPAYFSNFSFTPASNLALKGKARPPGQTPVGGVMSWMVSGVFEGKMLDRKHQLTERDKQNLQWTRLSSEPTGLANLARVQGVRGDTNTVFARVIIQSEKDQVKKMQFGFSDEVKVYVNDRLVYGGNDGYQSRDYRFLGTLGLYDELYLPLRQGPNEVWFAVTEHFGGWGIKAVLEDPEGVRSMK